MKYNYHLYCAIVIILTMCFLCACNSEAEAPDTSELESQTTTVEIDTVVPENLRLTEMVVNSSGKTQTHTYQYDTSGRLIGETFTDSGNSTLSTVTEYRYDENGFRNYESAFYTSYNMAQTESWTNNKDGNKLDGKIMQGDTLFVGYSNTYNEAGHLIREVETNAEGAETSVSEYEYTDSYGSYIKLTFTGSTERITEKKLDAAGNELSYRLTIGGKLTTEIVYEHDDKGNLISYKSGDNVYTYTYEYDGDLIICVTELDNDGDTVTSKTSEYDKYGNLTESVIKNASGIETSRTIYKYSDISKAQ